MVKHWMEIKDHVGSLSLFKLQVARGDESIDQSTQESIQQVLEGSM